MLYTPEELKAALDTPDADLDNPVSAAPRALRPWLPEAGRIGALIVTGATLVVVGIVLAGPAAQLLRGAAAGWLLPAGLAGFALLGSLLLAVRERQVVAVVARARARLNEWRHGPLVRATAALRTDVRGFVQARLAQPAKPLVAALHGIALAVEQAGRREAVALARLEARLARDLTELADLPARLEQHKGAAAAVEPAPPADGGGIALARLAVIALSVLLVTGLAAWVLAAFAPAADATSAEAAVDGSVAARRLLWLVSVAIATAAVSAGMLMYEPDPRAPAQPSVSLHSGLLLLVLVLVLICGLGFIPVAARVDPAAVFGVDPTSFIFPLMQFTVLLLGASTPVVLATLGHAAAAQLQRHAHARSARLPAERFGRSTRALESLIGRLNRLSQELALTRASVESMPAGAAGQLEEKLRGIAAELGRTGRAGRAAPAPRRPREVIAGLVLDLLLLAVWVLAAGVLFGYFAAALAEHGTLTGGSARMAAAAVVLALGSAGFVAKETLWAPSHVVMLPAAIHTPALRRAVIVLVLAILAAGGFATLWLVATEAASASGALIGLVYGLLLLLGLVSASLRLDAGLVAALHAITAVSLAAAWLACLVARALLASGEAGLGVLPGMIRLAAVPGAALRDGLARLRD